MMSNPRAAHPPDVDLVDFVDGLLDAAGRRIVEEHLTACLSCRIKHQRMAQTPPIDLTDIRDIAVPQFDAVDVEEADPTAARAGELWLTATDDAAMVLVAKVRPNGWGVVVVPVVFDIEVADSGTLVLDEAASPLAVPIAIYDGMLNSLPTSALRGRVVPTRAGVDLLRISEADPGVSRGTPLEGPADARHEVRQYINDQVVSVDVPTTGRREDRQTSGPIRVIQPMNQATVDAQFSELQRGFVSRADTTVEPLAMRLPDLVPSDWEGIAQIRAFNQRVLLLFVDGGLPDDRGPARALCNALGGSALAVRAQVSSPIVDVYSRLELSVSHSVQTGAAFAEPFISGPVVTAVSKYLDAMVTIVAKLRSPIARMSSIDPKEILRGQVARALDAQVATGRNAHIEPKQLGLMSVEGIGNELLELLRLALSERLDPAALIDLSNRRKP